MKIKFTFFFAITLLTLVGSVYANDSFKCGFGNQILGSDSKYVNAFSNYASSSSATTYHSAVSSGTSGCAGLVHSDKVRVEYIVHNYDILKEEASVGKGKHLYAMGSLMGCSTESNVAFAELTKKQYSEIFEEANNSELDILNIIKLGIYNNTNLSNSCQIQS